MIGNIIGSIDPFKATENPLKVFMYNREFSYFERYVSTAKDQRKWNDLGYDFLTRNGTKIEEKVSSLQLRKDGYLFYQFGRISGREKRTADRFIFFCDAEDRGLIIFDVPAEKLREKLGERTNLTIPAGSAHYCYGRTKHAWLDAYRIDLLELFRYR